MTGTPGSLRGRIARNTHMDSLKGHFLVGSPHLADPNFYHSVVLIVQHDADGALGLILNRPMSHTVAELWRMLEKPDIDCPRPIYLGGPVAGPLMALHTQLAYSQIQVVPGVHFATAKEYIEEIVTAADRRWLLFNGYSGWGAGQLEGELQQGGWLTVEATDDDVFHAGDDLWERLVQRIGLEIVAPAFRSSHVPPDPSVN
jgi:putative transcriptional regulator